MFYHLLDTVNTNQIISEVSDTRAGSCLLYDNYQFGLFICLCCVAAKFVSLLFYIIIEVVFGKEISKENHQENQQRLNEM